MDAKTSAEKQLLNQWLSGKIDDQTYEALKKRLSKTHQDALSGQEPDGYRVKSYREMVLRR